MKPSKKLLSTMIAKCHAINPTGGNVNRIIEFKIRIETYAAKMGLYIFDDEILKIDSMIRLAKISNFYNDKEIKNTGTFYTDFYDDNGWDYYNPDNYWPDN
jgi:hypothetical protein